MQNVIARAAIVAAFATLASSAFAASTTELKVTGRIVPFACTPTVGGGGTVDYGNIPASSLNKSTPTKLDTKEVPFTFSCEGSTKVALKFTDNRSASKVTGLGTLADTNNVEENMMGLGSSSGKKIGAYMVMLKQGAFTADGSTVDTIYSTNSGSMWTKGTRGAFRTTSWLSWSATGTTTPVAVKTVSGTLSVTAIIDKTDNLNLTTDVSLDGSGTIEVVYL